jgi:hypothetical protein
MEYRSSPVSLEKSLELNQPSETMGNVINGRGEIEVENKASIGWFIF